MNSKTSNTCVLLSSDPIKSSSRNTGIPSILSSHFTAGSDADRQDGVGKFLPAQSSDAFLKSAARNRTYPRRNWHHLQVTPPDSHGYVSLGLDTFYTGAIMEQVSISLPKSMTRCEAYGRPISRFKIYRFFRKFQPIPAVPTPRQRIWKFRWRKIGRPDEGPGLFPGRHRRNSGDDQQIASGQQPEGSRCSYGNGPPGQTFW